MDGTMELKRAEVWIYQMEKYNKHENHVYPPWYAFLVHLVGDGTWNMD